MIGLAGFIDISWKWWYYLWFILLGMVQSITFPAYISIVSGWFDKKNRGLIVNGFTSCVNIGNIVGVQLASVILDASNNQWGYNLIFAASLFTVMAILNALFLVPTPQKAGILLDDAEFDKLFRSTVVTTERGSIHTSMKSSVIAIETQEKISFCRAWFLPKVLLYASTFFFVKMSLNIMIF